MLTWYEAAKTDFFAESHVVALHEQGLQLMQVIKDVFPSRRVHIPRPPGPSSPGEPSIAVSSSSEDEEDESTDVGPWCIPKFHAIEHVPEAIRLYGRSVQPAIVCNWYHICLFSSPARRATRSHVFGVHPGSTTVQQQQWKPSTWM